MKKNVLITLMIAASLTYACQQGANKGETEETTSDSVEQKAFDTVVDGKEVKLYTLQKESLRVSLTNYGARLVSLNVKDKEGNETDVILGYDTADEFKQNASNFYGAVVGRYGNRIGDASFTLNGETYELEKNDGGNSLHGGANGVYNQVWDVEMVSDTLITLVYTSPDGEAGYPGTVTMKVTYSLNSEGGLVIDYDAGTDKETVLNLTNHAYFNLNGAGDSSILDHELQIDADAITEVNEVLIPTGKNLRVEGTAFDFRKPEAIGARIDADNEQLKIGKGYDHNFELSKKDGFQKVASVYSSKTGIEMQVLTTEPGLQFYSGNFMTDSDPKGKGGKTYGFRSAFCLETQHYPDAPNQASFPPTILKPGEQYTSKTEYRFFVR